MNRLLLRHVVVPLLLVTTCLLGGLRVVAETNELRFVPPPLVALLLAAFLFALFSRSGLVEVGRDWIGDARTPLENASNALTLVALFFAGAQVFNAVVPEDTLFGFVFSLFFFLVFWNSLFAFTRPDRFVKSLAGLLLASFVAKYMLLAHLTAPSDSLAGSLAKALLRGVTLGGLEAPAYAGAAGYVAFAAVAFYLVALWAASPPRDAARERLFDLLVERGALTRLEERRVLAALAPGAERDFVDAEIVREEDDTE